MLFSFFLFLLLLGLSDDLERSFATTIQDLPPSAFSSGLCQTVRSFHRHPLALNLTRSLASSLVPSEGLGLKAAVKRFAFTILINLQKNRETILITYLNRVHLGNIARDQISGFPQAATVHFGVSHTNLTKGEIALLCDLALDPQGNKPFLNPRESLLKREKILRRLYNSGIISPFEFRTETNLPLSLSVDHRPIL